MMYLPFRNEIQVIRKSKPKCDKCGNQHCGTAQLKGNVWNACRTHVTCIQKVHETRLSKCKISQ